MTDEELIKLARELQFAYYYETGETVGLGKLRAFADRVAEREREACAKVCADLAAHRDLGSYGMLVAHSCANEILARGQA